jgi:hypothetical protein
MNILVFLQQHIELPKFKTGKLMHKFFNIKLEILKQMGMPARDGYPKKTKYEEKTDLMLLYCSSILAICM